MAERPGVGAAGDVDHPSRFWSRLSAEHERDLERFRFDTFKRHQALRYFNWRWHVRGAPTSEQLRFLLAHTSPRAWVRAAAAPVDVSDAAWAGCSWPVRDRRFYAFAVRLLWQYAESHGAGDVLRLPEPALGDPFPVFWHGRLISQDLANSALEIASIREAVGGRDIRDVLEVGAGYGRTAYALLNVCPHARYTVVDIEPALTICRRYLCELFAPERLTFLTPAQAASISPASVDVALSISSLPEMTPGQVERYLEIFDRAAANGFVFLKQWRTWRNPDDQVTSRFADYPIPPRWRPRFDRHAAVQTGFQEAAWHVPPLGGSTLRRTQ